MLERRAYQERPRRHEYTLTQKGLELVPALVALMQWGDHWAWDCELWRRSCPSRSAAASPVSVELRCPTLRAKKSRRAKLLVTPRGIGCPIPPVNYEPGYLSRSEAVRG